MEHVANILRYKLQRKYSVFHPKKPLKPFEMHLLDISDLATTT